MELQNPLRSQNDKLNIGGYRNARMWQPKINYIKSEEVNPPPECPMHKKDFKDKQGELTDLNWDGSRSKKLDRE